MTVIKRSGLKMLETGVPMECASVFRFGAALRRLWGRMNLHLATVVIGCLVVLAVVGVIVKLLLSDIGGGDTCPYCSAPVERPASRFVQTVTRL
jgi:hypothetical protein